MLNELLHSHTRKEINIKELINKAIDQEQNKFFHRRKELRDKLFKISGELTIRLIKECVDKGYDIRIIDPVKFIVQRKK